MVDVVYSANNLTVLGGPARLDVDFEIGANGQRGSLFFTGLANPNTLNLLQDFPSPPQPFDIFINVNSADENYLQAYQYTLQDGGQVWSRSFNLNNETFVSNEIVAFTSGEAMINLDITKLGLASSLFEGLNNSFAYFNVQATPSNINSEEAPDGLNLNHYPIALSVSVGDAFFDSTGLTDPADFPLKLPIYFKAVEYDGSSWSEVDDKDIIVYLSVSYADPNKIIANLGGGTS